MYAESQTSLPLATDDPWQRYQRDLAQPGFVHDPVQEQVVRELQALHTALVQAQPRNRLAQWWQLRRGTRQPLTGLYLWGGVGRGKTYLMDTFFDSLPLQQKLRLHFHRFMQRVQMDLKALAGVANPLEAVADRLAREARVLCFDEFFVSDIADAMILGKLLEALFQRGVTLVATSNIPPPLLYKDGLQRQRFLPAIALLEQHTRVLNVDGGTDYRLRTLERADLYFAPLGEAADANLADTFARLAPGHAMHWERLLVNDRYISSRQLSDDVVWFEFAALCDGPRSQNDYIELARLYHTVFISNIPQLGDASNDMARRFINLVDEFYDRGVKLILAAAVPMQNLYTGSQLAFEFQRTLSRLQEMQSHDYLAMPHQP